MQFDRTAGLTENNFRSDNRGGPGRRFRLPFVCAKLQHDKGTELAQATAGTIRLRLLKLAARVEVSTRRLRVRLAESAPVQVLFAHAWRRLRPAPS